MNPPKLLVSVRNAAEARLLAGTACDILDVKEPSNGALGMADVKTIREIRETAAADLPLSVALGEAIDLDAPITLPEGLVYLKLGTSGLRGEPLWIERWLVAARRIEPPQLKLPEWVAVGYADAEAAGAPDPMEIIEAAFAVECSVFLLDTFTKVAGRSVFDWMTVAALRDLREEANDLGLQFALAGQLRTQHADLIRKVAPDIVGIRGAACRESDRKAEIVPELVNEFAAALAGDHVST